MTRIRARVGTEGPCYNGFTCRGSATMQFALLVWFISRGSPFQLKLRRSPPRAGTSILNQHDPSFLRCLLDNNPPARKSGGRTLGPGCGLQRRHRPHAATDTWSPELRFLDSSRQNRRCVSDAHARHQDCCHLARDSFLSLPVLFPFLYRSQAVE